MDAYQAIISKRDLRQYDTRPIPDDAIHRILQAGRMAGSSSNSQPVRYVALRNRDNIRALIPFGRGTSQLNEAPLYVLALLKEGAGAFDVGRGLQNMMLAAWAEGIHSCPVGLQDAEPVQRLLNVPEGYRVAIGVAFGYPAPGAPNTTARGQRVALEELVHWERW